MFSTLGSFYKLFGLLGNFGGPFSCFPCGSMVPKWFQNCYKMVSAIVPKCLQICSKACHQKSQHCTDMVPKGFAVAQDCHYMVPTHVPILCTNCQNMASKWSRNCHRTVPDCPKKLYNFKKCYNIVKIIRKLKIIN